MCVWMHVYMYVCVYVCVCVPASCAYLHSGIMGCSFLKDLHIQPPKNKKIKK